MKDKKVLKRLLAGALAAAVTVSAVVIPTTANGSRVDLSDLSSKGISVVSPQRDKMTEKDDPGYGDDDVVRVSIVLEDASTIKAGFDIETIAVDSKAVAYRDSLKIKQQAMEEKIEKATKENLDVVHNLTLAANIISANVKFGQIKAIEKISGVKSVFIETQYEAEKTVEDLPNDPNMSTSTKQIGSGVAWAEGYTGAGTKIAVIDTGIDSDHQSFAEDAFLYSLQQNAKELNKKFEDYKASLGLLDAAKVEAVADQLNAKIDAGKTFLSEKIPFAYNYVDEDYDITHDNDSQGGHGSHVEGISAANRYVSDGKGGYTKAIDSVMVQGVAPDAQIITMKVFGKGGGAYPADYMVAIEDAIILGADAINLSLGSGNAGTSRDENPEFQKILEDITKSGAVVAMSAGNSGHWADNATTQGYLYADDVNSQTDGSPGSYTNAFTVASADNIGTFGEYFTIGGHRVVYTQSLIGNEGAYTNQPLSTLAGEQEYVLIDGFGTPEDWAALGDVVKGKVALCSRGETSFYEKAEAAVEAGAIATIIYNNQPGSINMNLADYTKTAPCVSITQAEGELFRANGTPSEDGTYYTGKFTVEKDSTAVITNNGPSEMSSFSSWGVPGSLELKPEITAPGGNIYSVDGEYAETDKYVNMSGTSMASPQVAGMAALAAQYIKEKGLAEKTGLSARTLAQSLLMSTAQPMIEEVDGEYLYYPVLRQGAGLANIGSVVKAESYILMDETANAGAKDGKIKVELGDDPDRKGVYTIGFTIYNLTDSAKNYKLSADFFTQGLMFDGGAFNLFGENDLLIAKNTMMLETETTFDCGNTAAVPANGKIHVTATVAIGADDKAFLDEYMTAGAFLEGFVYADGESDAEGNITTSHSIPVFGFYGNWSTPSMFDKGSYEAYFLSGTEGRIPYLAAATDTESLRANSFGVTYGGVDGPYYFGGNNYIADQVYHPERNAVNNSDGTLLSMIQFAPIRNAADSRFIVYNETTKETIIDQSIGSVDSAYYYDNQGRWLNPVVTAKPGYNFGGAKEGDKLNITFALAPEYYQDAEGNVRWKDVDLSSALQTTVTIDNTKPEIVKAPVVKDGKLTVTVKDNQYIAAVLLTNKSGSKIYASVGADETAKAGDEYEVEIDVSEINADMLYMQVCDYANNTVTVEIDEKFGEGTILPGKIAFNTEFGYDYWTSFEGLSVSPEDVEVKYEDSNHMITAATIADHIVYAMDEDGVLMAMPDSDLLDVKEIINVQDFFEDEIMALDMAYNAKDGKIYAIIGVVDGYDISEETYLLSFDKLNCVPELVGLVPFSTFTLACDPEGNFYSAERGTGKIYKYTAEGVAAKAAAELVMDLAEKNEKLICGNYSIQAMEYDTNTNKLCWALYSPEMESYYIEADLAGKSFEASENIVAQLCALIIPDQSTPSVTPEWAKPTDDIEMILLKGETTMIKNASQNVKATVLPWTVNSTALDWSSSDEKVVTVDQNGKVNAISDGTATVYAYSKTDKEVYGSLEIEVETLNMVLNGTLQDEEGNPLMYRWNMSNSATWKSTNDLKSSMISATVNTNNGHLYVMDGTSGSWGMHEIDPTDGSEVSVASNSLGVPLWDLAYSEAFSTEEQPLVMGVYGPMLVGPTNPMALEPYAFDFSMYLMFYTGAEYFVSLASMGAEDIYDEETDETYAAEKFAALDNLGYLWLFDIYALSGEDEGLYGCFINNSTKTHLSETYPLAISDGIAASMVMGEDGYLYLSACDGDTNNVYQLDVSVWKEHDEEYDETIEMVDYTVRKIGDAGENVWPMLLTSAVSSIVTETDEETGVTVTYIFIEDGVRLSVEVTGSTETSITYDLELIDANGEVIENPDGTVTVKIPVPEGFDTEKVGVYVQNADGTYTKIDAEVVDGYLVFTTETLGEFVVSTEALDAEKPAESTTEETEAPEVTTTPDETEAPAETTGVTSDPGKDDPDDNKPTGIAIAFVPAAAAAAAVVFARKRDKRK